MSTPYVQITKPAPGKDDWYYSKEFIGSIWPVKESHDGNFDLAKDSGLPTRRYISKEDCTPYVFPTPDKDQHSITTEQLKELHAGIQDYTVPAVRRAQLLEEWFPAVFAPPVTQNKENRREIKGKNGESYMVIMEGLQNNPDINESVREVAVDILKEAHATDCHLSDIGFRLRCYSQKLSELSKLCFDRHEEEKKPLPPVSYQIGDRFTNESATHRVYELVPVGPDKVALLMDNEYFYFNWRNEEDEDYEPKPIKVNSQEAITEAELKQIIGIYRNKFTKI